MSTHIYQYVILLLTIFLPHISYGSDDIKFDQNFGISLLHEEKYAESEAYFERHLEGNAVAYYGLALSKFRKNAINLTIENTKEISALYENAIQLSPSFSDAYLMCAISYYATARFQLISLKKNKKSPEHLNEPYALLEKANAYLNKAIYLNPQYENLVRQEKESIEKLKTELNNLKSESI